MNGHALVVGGGIGGLLAAHALAHRVQRVTLLERDHYPADSDAQGPPARRGAPQSRCLHLLMAAGAAAIDELMPGWREQLTALGAISFDASADAVRCGASGWLPRTPSGITTYASSRALLERVMRCGLPAAVRVREGCRVVGLLGSRAAGVDGVRLVDENGHESVMSADLVVDASGSGSMLPAWLGALPGAGLAVEETAVPSGTRYVSRWFHLAAADAPDWCCLAVAPAVHRGWRGAMMLRAERDFWGVVLVSCRDESMPGDSADFDRFVADLGDGMLQRALVRATAVSPVHHYPSGSSRMKHYERVTDWPPRLMAIGDGVCALDPYFGLGMTAAARGAVLLRAALDPDRGPARSGLDFQRELAILNAGPWRLATGRDADGGLAGEVEAHRARLYAAAPMRDDIAHALLGVEHLLRPMESLMQLSLE